MAPSRPMSWPLPPQSAAITTDEADQESILFQPSVVSDRPYQTPTLYYMPSQWRDETTMQHYPHVTTQSSKAMAEFLVVKKIVSLSKVTDTWLGSVPHEVQIMKRLGGCNRIVTHLAYQHGFPTPEVATIIFSHYPLGDLSTWRKSICVDNNFTPVPESYIWRLFIHMTQALIFLQNDFGPLALQHTPNGAVRESIIHCDIKPGNVLVVDNGTSYPSFKLHDFGVAAVFTPTSLQTPAYHGTYEWQPREHPMIISHKADIYSMGALVYFLATGECPVRYDVAQRWKQTMRWISGGDVSEARNMYSSIDRFYVATCQRVVYPINLTQEEQALLGINSRAPGAYLSQYNAEYSAELNSWMMKCLSECIRTRSTLINLSSGMFPLAVVMLKSIGGREALADLTLQIRDDALLDVLA